VPVQASRAALVITCRLAREDATFEQFNQTVEIRKP
jgi:hypothetical protein